MFSLLTGSVLVVMLVLLSGDPRNWRWFAPEAAPAEPAQRVTHAADEVTLAVADVQPAPAGQPDEKSAEPAAVATGAKLFPGVRSDYLDSVRDDTVFRPSESDAWFHLWELIGRTDNAALVNASEGPVSYLQLEQQPNEYRGHVVTVSGTVRAAKLVPAPENGFGIKQYYQLWLQPDRARPALVVVYCHDLPEGFPLGERVEADVTAAGFFFKRWAYPSQDGIVTAPLIVARTVDWRQPPPAAAPAARNVAEDLLWAVAVSLVMAVLALGLVAWRSQSAPRRKKPLADDHQVGAVLAELDAGPLAEGHDSQQSESP